MKNLFLSLGLFLVLHFVFAPVSAVAQSDDDCLTCHGDASLTMEKKGKQASIFVDPKKFSSSSHGPLSCLDCHTGYRADEIPHRKTPFAQDCLKCHEDLRGRHVFHPELERELEKGKSNRMVCSECHDVHYIPSPEGEDSVRHEARVNEICRKCHTDVQDSYSASAHGQAASSGVPGAPGCLTCHRHEVSNF